LRLFHGAVFSKRAPLSFTEPKAKAKKKERGHAKKETVEKKSDS
jgi:hypothetical protein